MNFFLCEQERQWKISMREGKVFVNMEGWKLFLVLFIFKRVKVRFAKITTKVSESRSIDYPSDSGNPITRLQHATSRNSFSTSQGSLAFGKLLLISLKENLESVSIMSRNLPSAQIRIEPFPLLFYNANIRFPPHSKYFHS